MSDFCDNPNCEQCPMTDAKRIAKLRAALKEACEIYTMQPEHLPGFDRLGRIRALAALAERDE